MGNLRNALAGVLVTLGCRPRDHQDLLRIEHAEVGGGLVCERIAKVVQARVIGLVLERQHEHANRSGWRGRRRLRSKDLQTLEAIAFALDGQQMPRVLGVFAKGYANFADRRIDAIVGVAKRVSAPQRLDDVSTRHKLPAARCHQDEQFHWHAFKPDLLAATAQFVALDVQFNIRNSHGTGVVHVRSPRRRSVNCSPERPVLRETVSSQTTPQSRAPHTAP